MKRLTAEEKASLAQNIRHIEELYEQCFLICNGKIPHTLWACIRTAHHYAKRANFKVIRLKHLIYLLKMIRKWGFFLRNKLAQCESITVIFDLLSKT